VGGGCEGCVSTGGGGGVSPYSVVFDTCCYVSTRVCEHPSKTTVLIDFTSITELLITSIIEVNTVLIIEELIFTVFNGLPVTRSHTIIILSFELFTKLPFLSCLT
jgi:hypothetical protein